VLIELKIENFFFLYTVFLSFQPLVKML